MDAWQHHRDLLHNTVSLLGTTGVTSGLGFAFWTVAAREFSQQSVGFGAAAVSAMSLLSTVGMFGLGTVLIGELPRRNNRAGLVSAALLTSGSASFFLGLAFVVIASLVSKRFDAMLGKPTQALVFSVGVAIGAVALVFDNATIGLLRGGVQLWRNLVFAAFKLAVLPVTAVLLHDQFGAGIYVSWAGGIAASLAVSAIWLYSRGAPIFQAPDWGVLRALGKTTVAHNWLNLAIAVPVTLIPVLVTVVISPAANAVFYVAWMLTSFLWAIPAALATVLFAVVAANPRVIALKLRFALKLCFLVGVPAMLVLIFGAHFALSLFGSSYAHEATVPLIWLALTYIPGLPKSFYIAVCRATGNISRAAVVLTAFAAIDIASAVIFGHFGGLKGLCEANLVVAVIQGVATAPRVLGALSLRAANKASQRDRRRSFSRARQSSELSETRADYYLGAAEQAYWPSHADRQLAGITALTQLARLQRRTRGDIP